MTDPSATPPPQTLPGEPSEPAQAPPAAPPTTAPPARPEPSAWPGVLGTIAIVLGAFGALGSLFGAVAILGMPRLFRRMLPPEAMAAMQASTPHQAATCALQALSLALAILLVVAGARLAQRRPSGAALLRRWAWLKIVIVLVSVAIGAMMAPAQFRAMQASGAGGPPPALQFIGPLIGACFGLVWGWALPIFSLVWLGRAKVRSEIETWAP